jgi:DNA polymerase delta subunit 2
VGLADIGNRLSEDDSVILEDVSGRATLIFAEKNGLTHKQQVDQLVTGIIAACYGEVDEAGHFVVSDLVTVDYPPQPERPILENDQYVALVCGISVGHPKFNLLGTQLLIDYLNGTLGGDTEQDVIISKIIRTVFVGNSDYAPPYERRLFDVRGSLRPAERASLVEPTRAVDRLVEQIAYTMHVDVMPGEQDPSNTALPQQPLHPSMFPRSATLSTCHLVTNPYQFNLMGVE